MVSGVKVCPCAWACSNMCDAECVVDQYRIGQQAEATRPIHHLVIVARTKHALIRKEQAPREIVPGFAATQLRADLLPQQWIAQVPQEVDGFHQASQVGERQRQPMGCGTVDEALALTCTDDTIFERRRPGRGHPTARR